MKAKANSGKVSDNNNNNNNNNLNTNLILDILGNSTRRRILFLLSKEPLYFNQLSKIIRIGQQAILRHMKILEDSGLIETYAQESNLGAPDRKYYRLASTFSMNMVFSQDGFYIRNNEIKELRHKEYEKLYKEYENSIAEYHNKKNKNFHKIGLLLDLFKNTLIEIEKEISQHESKINDLQALRHIVLRDIHKIGKDNFDFSERQIIYSFMDKHTPPSSSSSSSSVAELTDILDKNETAIKTSVKKLITNRFTEDKTSIFESSKKSDK
ncbi:MAG TPA: ArsR family transcriptional regulator [Nitrososphaeraceae archaeon]|nr:ArsR family transcriptional regulator [Nitrososphaeraceae archaeon]